MKKKLTTGLMAFAAIAATLTPPVTATAAHRTAPAAQSGQVSGAPATTGSVTADGASTAPGRASHFMSQSRNLGLTAAQARALQTEAEANVARTGGTQVAPNRIDLGGAIMTLAVPGEKYARDLTQPRSTRALASCAYGHMCAYKDRNYTGNTIDMLRCADYRIPWLTRGSWINNQTRGTRARFMSSDRVVRWTSPGAYSSDPNADWSWVHWVRNC
ncbi:hypothetical protein ACFVIM_02460 [Streptomyces sp. NPDC057638]|uniref:hypothetical protein n=1 Tax=Streptomyces sp. NPDC057638 TaxID=3346190 RepID=UPI0036B90363